MGHQGTIVEHWSYETLCLKMLAGRVTKGKLIRTGKLLKPEAQPLPDNSNSTS
uniref:Uncharacterized protein n=1 Tax=Vitis vinifera TaxID=29760 RepID=F6GYJ0_VITVI